MCLTSLTMMVGYLHELPFENFNVFLNSLFSGTRLHLLDNNGFIGFILQ